jgi:hypothetical protein
LDVQEILLLELFDEEAGRLMPIKWEEEEVI